MNTEKYAGYDTGGFLLDDDFSKWVKHPDPEKDLLMSRFLDSHPSRRKPVQEAVFILRSLQPVEPEVTLRKPDFLFRKYTTGTVSLRKVRKWMKAAAVILFLAAAGSLTYFLAQKKQPFLPELAVAEKAGKGMMILSDGSVHEFDTEVTQIRQDASGVVHVNGESITCTPGKPEKNQMILNQVVVPFGKRSDIILPDGTHIWLNSGSRLHYPTTFEDHSREVILSGEAFFDVVSDASRPFYVTMKDMKVKVLGTRFNLTSYPDDPTTQAILLAGKITAGKNRLFTRSIDLVPGERIVYEKSTESFVKDKVDVNVYSSWVDGYLIFRSQPVHDVIKKLERYYNQRIVVEKGLENVTYSGKLDLVESLESVLGNISFTSSFTLKYEDGIFNIKP
jgi:ferric-dicitrate binding protein FerR (iron transport regulator)